MKKTSRMIACFMLFMAIIFLSFALAHPEMGMPWHNDITFAIYLIYGIVMIILFIAPFKEK